MQKSVILLVAIIILSHAVYGQSEQVSPERIHKNVVQASAGSMVVVGAYGINYERLLVQFEDNSLIGLWGKAGIGGWAEYGNNGGDYQQLTAGLLIGKSRGHLELNLGGARMYNQQGFENYWMINDPQAKPVKSDYVRLSPVGSLGYRFQKREGGFLFRTGLGYPEGIFVGLGASF
ncbi:MAG: hypothetical protein WA960_13445 [Tunicatimonas sp.]